jgi:Protein kinase domain
MKTGELVQDRYVIQALAGSGGMGQVYRALDTHSGDTVAIKVVGAQGSGDPIRFAREVEILAEVDDPGVVRYRGHGQSPSGDAYLIMDWLDGEDLKAYLQQRRLGVAEAVEIVNAVARSLGTLHERNIVHRDLKPGNVFLLGLVFRSFIRQCCLARSRRSSSNPWTRKFQYRCRFAPHPPKPPSPRRFAPRRVPTRLRLTHQR